MQRYKYPICGKQFLNKNRAPPNNLWKEYTEGKQTYIQLAQKYNCSSKTIQRKIDSVKIERQSHFESAANVLLDTAYFGRKFGIMVFKDSISGSFYSSNISKLKRINYTWQTLKK